MGRQLINGGRRELRKTESDYGEYNTIRVKYKLVRDKYKIIREIESDQGVIDADQGNKIRLGGTEVESDYGGGNRIFLVKIEAAQLLQLIDILKAAQ